MPQFMDYPFAIDGRGRTRTTDRGDHIRDMIYLVLFTRPGERVNRPDFGCGLGSLIFEPNSQAQAVNTQFLVKTSLQRWLADAITVEKVSVEALGERLIINVDYVRLDNGQRQSDQFTSL
jgi:phage baseplate assembly protein W